MKQTTTCGVHEVTSLRANCPNCGGIIEFDVSRVPKKFHNGECPVCKHRTFESDEQPGGHSYLVDLAVALSKLAAVQLAEEPRFFELRMTQRNG